ncbi:MAG: hypothetical protein KJ062_21865, partial [Thermoanaerobaculia bacterium]|nr:hypothetical protein [Thermoanaerobaculia bacterium]
AVCVTLVSLAGCRKPSPSLNVAIHSAPVGMDPHLQNESLTVAVLANVFEALTEFDDELRIRPGLAESWRNPDGRTWRFSLRRGVRFHDGRPLEAEDVVFSLERASKHPGSGLASHLVQLETVRALDPRTVEIVTRRPFAALLERLTLVYVVPRDAPETIVEPVGTGPYRLAGNLGHQIRMVPAAGSWRGEPSGPALTFFVVPEPAERLRRLTSGEVDVAADLDESAVAVLRDSDCCREEVRPGSTVEYLHLAAFEPRFDDPRVREAVHLAIDRHRYVAEAHGGLGQPAGQLAVPGLFGYAPDLGASDRDVSRARALLAAAGYPGGFDVVLEHRTGRRADVLARMLAEAGIRAKPAEADWAELYGRLRRGEVGFYFGGVVAPTADSSDILDGYVHTRDGASGYGASNHSRYSNARADELIESASTSFSLVRRRELLQAAMRVVVEDRRFVPVAGLYQVYGVGKRVRFRPRLDLKLLGREISKE